MMRRLQVLLPSGSKMAEQLTDHYPYYLQHWLDTLSVSLSACLLAAVLAALFALIGLKYPLIQRALSPVIAMSQSFPLQAIGPVIIIALGAGFSTKMLIAFVITFFPIQAAVVTAFAETPARYLLYARLCNATFLRTVYSVRLPFALPRFIAALKVGFTLSVIGAVVAEFISPQGGIGEILLIAQSDFNVEAIYICILILVIQGLTIYSLLSWLERKVAKTRSAIV